MNRTAARLKELTILCSLALTAPRVHSHEPAQHKEASAGIKPVATKADPALIGKLIQQLRSDDFNIRAKASQHLAQLDDVPDALREAAKDLDAEVARRAQIAITLITARVEEREFQALVRELHKVELDRFVRRMVTDEKFAGDRQWQLIEAVAKAVIKETNKLSQRQFEIPDLKTMRRLLVSGEAKNPVLVRDSVLLSAGATPFITSVMNSIVIVDGDFMGATGIDDSLLIVRGNVGFVTSINRSIILATGYCEGATGCDSSFIQVNNQRIRFTSAHDSVLVRTIVKTTGKTNSRVLDVDKGPLQLLKFSPRPADDQLAWGEQVNDLAVAITPADQKDRFLIRWKNTGKEAMELSWARLNSRAGVNQSDDLLGHVFLKGPDGKLAPAREHPVVAGGAPFLSSTVVLGPGQTREEMIDLWTYVERPTVDGRFQLSIELEIVAGRRGREPDVKSWSGKVRSNVLNVTLGK